MIMKKCSIVKIVLCVFLFSNASQAEAVWGLSRLWNICTWPYSYFVSSAHAPQNVSVSDSSSSWSFWNWMPFRHAQQPADNVYKKVDEAEKDVALINFLNKVACSDWDLEHAKKIAAFININNVDDQIQSVIIERNAKQKGKEKDYDNGAGIGFDFDELPPVVQGNGGESSGEQFLRTVADNDWTLKQVQDQAELLGIQDEFFIGQLSSVIAERDAKQQGPGIMKVPVVEYEKAPDYRVNELQKLEAVCKKIDTDCPLFKSDLPSDDVRYCDAAIAFYSQQLDQYKTDFIRDVRDNESWKVSDALVLAQEEGFFDIPDLSFRKEIIDIAGPRIIKVADDVIALSQKRIQLIQEAGLDKGEPQTDKKELSGLTVDELLEKLDQNNKRRSQLRQEAHDQIKECNDALEGLSNAPLIRQPFALSYRKPGVVQDEHGNLLVSTQKDQSVKVPSLFEFLHQVQQSPQLIDSMNRRLQRAGFVGVDVGTITPQNALLLFNYLKHNPSAMQAIMHNKTMPAIEDTGKNARLKEILENGFKACERDQERERKMDALCALRNIECPQRVPFDSMRIKHLNALPKRLQDLSVLSPKELEKRLPYVHALYKNRHDIPELLPDLRRSSQKKLYWSKPFSTCKSSKVVDINEDQFVEISRSSEPFKKLLEIHNSNERRSLFLGDKNRYHLPHYILFVTHGTFARNGKSWHSIDSDTMQAVLAFAKTLPGDVEIVPLVWSGGNSDQARTECAQMICDTVNYFQGQECPVQDCKLIYFGHSHAGNGFNEATHHFKKPIHLAVTLCTPVRGKQYEPHHAGAEYYIHAYSHGDMIQPLGSDEIASLSLKAVRYSVDKDAVGGRKQQLKQFQGRGFNCNFHYVKKKGDQYTSIAPTHSGVADFLRYGLAGLIRSIQEGHISYDQDLNMGIIINDNGDSSKVYIAPRHQESISGDVSIVEQLLSFYAYTKKIKKDNEFREKTGVSLDGYKPSVMLQFYNAGCEKVLGPKSKPFEDDVSSSIIMPPATVIRHDKSPLRVIDDYYESVQELSTDLLQVMPKINVSLPSSPMLAIEWHQGF